MKCRLFIYNEDNNHVNKNELFIEEKDIQLKGQCSIINPTIIFKADGFLPNFNYLEIPDFNRKYFITDMVYDGNVVEVSCHCDVLSSFFHEIRNNVYLIERQEFKYNSYIVDNELLTRCDKRIYTENIGQCGGISNNYYLCTTGGE